GGVAVPADLERPEEAQRLADTVLGELGGAPDIVVNNAGVFSLARVHETEPAELERQLRVNLLAPFVLVRAFLPSMLARGDGHLVHIGSSAGSRPYPESGAYCITKYGLRGLHEVLELELAGTGVRTTLIETGSVDTGIWDPLQERLGVDLPRREHMLSSGLVADAVIRALRSRHVGVITDVGAITDVSAPTTT
ncbi:MAG: SDR family oxidoreductase, partial [Gemmatimonadetes bacterium]|nr:SDR family oxidoreductase [Gemmatimonadota bacterium]